MSKWPSTQKLETPFERHYGRKPRTELTSYLNLPTDKNDYVSAQPETLQVYSFNNGRGGYDQLIMKTPRKLKCDVSNNVPYKFLEKKTKQKQFWKWIRYKSANSRNQTHNNDGHK